MTAFAAGVGALVGLAVSAPVVVVSAATGLVLAVRRPRHPRHVLAVLLLWPVLASGLLAWSFLGSTAMGAPLRVAGLLVVLAVVVVAVTVTLGWVTQPVTARSNS